MKYLNNHNLLLDFMRVGVCPGYSSLLGYFTASGTAVAIPGRGEPDDKNAKRTYFYLITDQRIDISICAGSFANHLNEDELSAFIKICNKLSFYEDNF